MTAAQQRTAAGTTAARPLSALWPAAIAAGYPFLLDLFHLLIGPAGAPASFAGRLAAGLLLALAIAAPLAGIPFARRADSTPALRCLACASVAAPTLYVFLGVVNFMAGGFYPDQLLWCLLWAGLAAAALFAADHPAAGAPDNGRARVAHGLVAAMLLCYILFHILNHLFLLEGPAAHDAVRHFGERIYRSPAVEPLLVLLLLFQSASGLYLAWRWSGTRAPPGFFRAFQLASGIYLLAYIVGHMDSVFIYARLFQGIETDWRFAAGFPAGMLHDPWNIRLLPHYALGVFFALAHPLTGLRFLLLAHGWRRRLADACWLAGTMVAALVALFAILGLLAAAPGN